MAARRSAKPKYREINVDSWDDFGKTVLSLRYASWAFRGHSDARWPLESTLARRFKNARIDRRAWPAQERRILRTFKRKANLFLEDIPADWDTLRWLAIMQHHGAPTRLLDFTWSPYVAAFFALESASADAAIWAVNHPALSLPYKMITGGRPRTVDPHKWRLRADPKNYEKYFVHNRLSFVAWDSPYIMNQRLIAQSGSFLVPGTLAEPVEEILSRHPEPERVVVKFVLATGKLREAAMFELYRMNITHYTLFPGLDGLARSMGYEAETDRFRNPRTMKRQPGWRLRELS